MDILLSHVIFVCSLFSLIVIVFLPDHLNVILPKVNTWLLHAKHHLLSTHSQQIALTDNVQRVPHQ